MATKSTKQFQRFEERVRLVEIDENEVNLHVYVTKSIGPTA
jgi:hypothetical protein